MSVPGSAAAARSRSAVVAATSSHRLVDIGINWKPPRSWKAPSASQVRASPEQQLPPGCLPDKAAQLDRAAAAGVGAVMLTGTSLVSTLTAQAYAHEARLQQHGVDMYYTAGIHPHSARQWNQGAIKAFGTLYFSDSRCVAIGECGLDYHRMLSPKQTQLDCLKAHVELAKQLDAPLFLHERDADEVQQRQGSHADMVAVLEEYDVSVSKVCVHCYTDGDESHLLDYVSRGYMIGLTGFICKKGRAATLRQLLQRKLLPLEQIMVETDSPYMAPPRWKARSNEPASLPLVVEELASLLELPVERVAEQTTANAASFFGLSGRS